MLFDFVLAASVAGMLELPEALQIDELPPRINDEPHNLPLLLSSAHFVQSAFGKRLAANRKEVEKYAESLRLARAERERVLAELTRVTTEQEDEGAADEEVRRLKAETAAIKWWKTAETTAKSVATCERALTTMKNRSGIERGVLQDVLGHITRVVGIRCQESVASAG